MGIKVIEKGLLTSIQDLGRFGYAGMGVPQSGVMDRYSAKMANLLVGNKKFEAVLEITLMGPVLKFTKSTLCVVVGIEAQVSLNEMKIKLLQPFWVQDGDVLHIKQVTQGARVYLAISGGFQTDNYLKSRSQFFPISENSQIQKGERLPFKRKAKEEASNFAGINYDIKNLSSSSLNVYKGPEWDKVPKTTQLQILENWLTVSKNNNRMAYQLQEQFPNHIEGMLSQPVLPGTVQLTPDGNLIVLMRDAQTTGGYPRVFQLTEESIQILSQKKQGDQLQFKLLN